MAMTELEIKQLNTMNKASQNVELGTMINALDASVVVPATTAVAGIVKQAVTQAPSTATDVAGLLADFNALITKLKNAGIMA